MKRYVVGQDRSQSTLFPESLDEYIAEDNPVRVVDVFVDELDLKDLGFEGATHILMKRLPNVRTEMSLHVLAYNLKRAMQIFGVIPLMQAIRA
jgi:transposase